MASSTKAVVLSLYKQLLRDSNKLTDYNFRTYAVRRVRDAFHENKNIKDTQQVDKLISKAQENLKIIQRQVMVGKLYGHGKLIIETK